MPTPSLPSPAVLIDAGALERNLQAMQDMCDARGTELWPHAKAHKLVPVLRRQLERGAAGATCAKLGEAEALLSSGVKRIFLAHSLVDFGHVPRLQKLNSQVDVLIVAATSERHVERLEAVLSAAGLRLPALMAVDTGLRREGARTPDSAARLAAQIRQSPHLELIGIYTHEGHAYQAASPLAAAALADRVHAQLGDYARAAGGDLPLWPGCSVTASLMAGRRGIKTVRPGSYCFGDLFLAETSRVMPFANLALSVLVTVIDRPEKGLALIDAGSKVFSSDRIPDGPFARCLEHPEITVSRLSEEHGFLSGAGVDNLHPGDRLQFFPAHACPVVNLASQVHLVHPESVTTWTVDARGRSD